MQYIALHTSAYKQALFSHADTWAKDQLCLIRRQKNSILLYWPNTATHTVAKALLLLLSHIAMMENQVYKYSPKLRDLAEGIQATAVHKQEQNQLAHFLSHNQELYLEGYATFRMEAYKKKLDFMLYTLAKKINFQKG